MKSHALRGNKGSRMVLLPELSERQIREVLGHGALKQADFIARLARELGSNSKSFDHPTHLGTKNKKILHDILRENKVFSRRIGHAIVWGLEPTAIDEFAAKRRLPKETSRRADRKSKEKVGPRDDGTAVSVERVRSLEAQVEELTRNMRGLGGRLSVFERKIAGFRQRLGHPVAEEATTVEADGALS